MLKLLVGLFGLLETLYPDRVVRLVTRLGYDYEGEPPVAKPWVVTAAQIEGMVLLGIVVYTAIRGSGSCWLCRGSDAADDGDGESVDRID